MMKSWLSYLLPEDEYKEKRILNFLAEGGVILFLLTVMTAIATVYFNVEMGLSSFLILLIAVYLFYTLLRYLISGIEYSDVVTRSSYKKELRVIIIKSVGFFVFFLIGYGALQIMSSESASTGWIDTLGLTSLASLFLFLMNYISLKRSYKKNKELM